MQIKINITKQKLYLYQDQKLVCDYLISSAAKGVGEQWASFQTPRGKHVIRAKIGAGAAENTVFRVRRPTGEIATPELVAQNPERDWMLTRILWLSGTEVGKNRLGNVDTMRRKIYIHGTPDSVEMGKPGSKGCIRMRNTDIIDLFERVPVGTPVLIEE